MDSDKTAPSPKERFLNLLLPPGGSVVSGGSSDPSSGGSEDPAVALAATGVSQAVAGLRGHPGMDGIDAELAKVEKLAEAARKKPRDEAVALLETLEKACAELERKADTYVEKTLVPGLASAIVKAGPGVAGYNNAKSSVNAWNRSRSGGAHDPLLTFEFMAVCRALSANVALRALLKGGHTDTVEQVVKAVGSLCGRQVIQAWGNHTTDLDDRAGAWEALLLGLDMLGGNPKGLGLYLSACLVHDKGYGQTFESAQGYFEIENVATEDDFPTLVRQMLAESSNTNIWTLAMAGSGKYGDQLATGPDLEALKKVPISLVKQEENMWARVVAELITRHNPSEKDWAYAVTIGASRQALFSAVQTLCTTYTLDPKLLDKVLEDLGA